jgi:anti-sigma B factor antagonist
LIEPYGAMGSERRIAVAELRRTALDGGVVSIEIGGEFDLADADHASELIDASLDGPPLLIDLSDCDFIDSTAIRILIQTHHRAREAAAPLAIAGSGPQVKRLFELTGLVDALPIFYDRDQALGHLAESASADGGNRTSG